MSGSGRGDRGAYNREYQRHRRALRSPEERQAWRERRHAYREQERTYWREWYRRNVVQVGGERWVLSKTAPEIRDVLLVLREARQTIRQAQRRTA